MGRKTNEMGGRRENSISVVKDIVFCFISLYSTLSLFHPLINKGKER